LKSGDEAYRHTKSNTLTHTHTHTHIKHRKNTKNYYNANIKIGL